MDDNQVRVVVAGRRDIEALFAKSDLLFVKKLTHTPFLAFIRWEHEIRVEIIDNVNNLLLLPDETPVMAQWRGEWRSDYFQFTVGDVRAYMQSAGR